MIKTILVIILILLLCFFIFNNVETFVGVDLLNDFYFDNTVNINDKSINARRICIFKRNSSNTKVEDHECIDANQLLSTLKLDESRKKLVCLDNNCLNKSDIRLLNGSDSFKLKNKYWSNSCVGGYADVKLKRCGHGQKISWLPQFVRNWWYKMNIKSAQYKTDTNPITKKTENSHIELIYENGEKWQVPLTEGNMHYDEIMKQVEEKTLTIKDAD